MIQRLRRWYAGSREARPRAPWSPPVSRTTPVDQFDAEVAALRDPLRAELERIRSGPFNP